MEFQRNKIIGGRGTNQFDKARRLGLSVPKVSDITREKLSRHFLENPRHHTEEFKRQQSIRAKDRGLGGITQSRWVIYNGKKLGSSYELRLAKSLDENNIRWNTCGRFSYIDPFGKARTYTPDIYLIDYDIYLEPKNEYLIDSINPNLGFKDTEKIERACRQNNIIVLLLRESELDWKIVLDKIQKLDRNIFIL